MAKSKGVEKLFHANGNQKRARVAKVKSDKIDFTSKRRKFHINKMVNTAKGYNNYKYLHTQWQTIKYEMQPYIGQQIKPGYILRQISYKVASLARDELTN